MKYVLTFFFSFFLISPFALAGEEAPASDATPAAAAEPASQAVDHNDWNLILKGLVLERQTVLELANNKSTGSRTMYESRLKKGMDINYVPYKMIKREFEQILFVLEIYIQKMWQVEVSNLTRDEQLAFWLNLRNALVVHSIFAHTPLKGEALKDLYFGTPDKASEWDTKKVWVEGNLLSISDIEDIILTGWPDPRVIYGLFYGAKGGPFLMNQAFTGEAVYTLLEENARAYLNASNTINVSRKKGAQIPVVFDWYSGLFGDSPAAILTHLKTYAEPKLSNKLAGAALDKISYSFDWELNDLPRRIGGFNMDEMFLSSNLSQPCFNLGCGGDVLMGGRSFQPKGN